MRKEGARARRDSYKDSSISYFKEIEKDEGEEDRGSMGDTVNTQ